MFWIRLDGTAPGLRFGLEVEGVEVEIAGARAGEARIGVNGLNANGEERLPRAVRVASSLFCVRASVKLEVGRSESNCKREPERLSRSVGGAGIE